MPANANVFAQYLQPVKSSADYAAEMDARDLRAAQLAGQQRQNALAQLTYQGQVDQIAQQQAERNALQRIAAGWGADTTPDQRIAALRGSGLPGLMSQADTLEKQAIERQKTTAEVGKTNAETLAKHLDAMGSLARSVMSNPTPQAAQRALAQWEAYTGRQDASERAQVADITTPEQAMAWARAHAFKADDLKAQIGTVDLGGRKVTQAVDPLTGKVVPLASQQVTVSPDAQLQAQTSTANNIRSVSAERDKAQATRDAANIQSGFQNEAGLRKEFEGLPEVKNYKQAYPSYASIIDASTRSTPMADINLVYGLAKLYDPNSVVREGEYATVANSPSIPERVKGWAQYLAGGGKLTPAIKQQIVDEAAGRIGAYQAEAGKARKSYEGIAKRRGIDPSNVFADMGDFGGAPDDIAAILKKHGGKK